MFIGITKMGIGQGVPAFITGITVIGMMYDFLLQSPYLQLDKVSQYLWE